MLVHCDHCQRVFDLELGDPASDHILCDYCLEEEGF